MSGLATRSTSRPNPRLIAAFAVGAAGLAITGGGVYAALNATASNTTAQNATSGVLSLTISNQASFSQGIANLAPGDVVNRYVTLTQGAGLDGKDMTLAVSDATPTLLTTDADRGLRVTVTQCIGGDWTAGACTGADASAAPLATGVSLKSLASTPKMLVSSVAAGATVKLQLALTLPDQDETTVNGVPTAPNGAASIQGLSSALTWTFSETQRTAATTGS